MALISFPRDDLVAITSRLRTDGFVAQFSDWSTSPIQNISRGTGWWSGTVTFSEYEREDANSAEIEAFLRAILPGQSFDIPIWRLNRDRDAERFPNHDETTDAQSVMARFISPNPSAPRVGSRARLTLDTTAPAGGGLRAGDWISLHDPYAGASQVPPRERHHGAYQCIGNQSGFEVDVTPLPPNPATSGFTTLRLQTRKPTMRAISVGPNPEVVHSGEFMERTVIEYRSIVGGD